MVAMSLLTTRNLSRHFGGLKAVDNVDFELPAGQVRALIGPNGAGKTTFVGMLSGRIPASQGQVFSMVEISRRNRRIDGFAPAWLTPSDYVDIWSPSGDRECRAGCALADWWR